MLLSKKSNNRLTTTPVSTEIMFLNTLHTVTSDHGFGLCVNHKLKPSGVRKVSWFKGGICHNFTGSLHKMKKYQWGLHVLSISSVSHFVSSTAAEDCLIKNLNSVFMYTVPGSISSNEFLNVVI